MFFSFFFLLFFTLCSGDSARDETNDNKRDRRTVYSVTEGKSMARKMINWMSRGTCSGPVCRSSFAIWATVVDDVPGFKTLNSIIIPRVSAWTHVVKTLTRLLSPLVVSRPKWIVISSSRCTQWELSGETFSFPFVVNVFISHFIEGEINSHELCATISQIVRISEEDLNYRSVELCQCHGAKKKKKGCCVRIFLFHGNYDAQEYSSDT